MIRMLLQTPSLLSMAKGGMRGGLRHLVCMPIAHQGWPGYNKTYTVLFEDEVKTGFIINHTGEELTRAIAENNISDDGNFFTCASADRGLLKKENI
jgi:hypothetical protein